MTEIGIIAVGGYNEMGRNMTGVRIDNDIIVLDMGLQLDRVQIHEDVEIDKMHSMDLIKMGAIPDDTIMKDAGGSVKAIVCTHGHLDHIGAISKLAHRYKAPIIATPYTAELVKYEISDEKKFRVNNEVIPYPDRIHTDPAQHCGFSFCSDPYSSWCGIVCKRFQTGQDAYDR
jgi:ribonuclease J